MAEEFEFLKGSKVLNVIIEEIGEKKFVVGLIVETRDGRRYKLMADDPSGCMGSGGYCFPFLAIEEVKE